MCGKGKEDKHLERFEMQRYDSASFKLINLVGGQGRRASRDTNQNYSYSEFFDDDEEEDDQPSRRAKTLKRKKACKADGKYIIYHDMIQ